MGKTLVERMREAIEENEVVLVDGLDEAFVGLAYRFNYTVAVYSYQETVNVVMREEGMTKEEAAEHVQYNIVGSYLGEGTPIFLFT